MTLANEVSQAAMTRRPASQGDGSARLAPSAFPDNAGSAESLPRGRRSGGAGFEAARRLFRLDAKCTSRGRGALERRTTGRPIVGFGRNTRP
jgi:hypothetical protein